MTSVAEPEHELWQQVKARGPQWPQPDEAGLQTLAQSWRDAATDFGTTRDYDTSGLNGPWADPIGGQFAARVQRTTARSGEVVTGMEAVAERTRAFADEIQRLKNKIVETVNGSIAIYDWAVSRGLGFLQERTIDMVAEQIRWLIQEAIAHISAYGTAMGTALDITREAQGVAKGVVDYAVESVRGMFTLPSIDDLIATVEEFKRDPWDALWAIVEDSYAPIVDDLNAGNVGEAIGRGLALGFDLLRPDGWARRTTKAMDALRRRREQNAPPPPAPAPASA
ncbi:MAG: hypothetical protein ACRDNL_12625, partial [Spirillospora sp.]